MLASVLAPLVDRVKVLLAARAVQELETDFVAGTTGRAGGLDRLAAAWAAGGLDGAAAEVQRRARVLAGGAEGAGGAALPGPTRGPRGRR
jgi:hypothetical protein